MKWLFVSVANLLKGEKDTDLVVERYKKEYDTEITIVYNTWPGYSSKLQDVKDYEMLIIVGHGDIDKGGKKNSEKIGIQEESIIGGPKKEGFFGLGDNEKTIITANDLAKMLERNGLPKSHVLIKTTSCCGGGLAREVNGRIGLIDNPCFASVLAKALYNLKPTGYQNIIVGGYPGYVQVHTRFKNGTPEKYTAKTITVRGQKTTGDFDGKRNTANWPEHKTNEAQILWYRGSNGQPMLVKPTLAQ
jgi:hypothetical protein